MDGQALAAILMTELTGARLVGRHGRRRRARAGAEDAPPARRAHRAACSAPRSRATRPPRSCAGSSSRSPRRPTGSTSTVPAFRRGDVTREIDLVEEVARLWGLDKLPYTLPSRRGATGVLAPEQRLRRRAEDALAGAGLSEVCGWVFAAPDLVDRLRIPADDPRHGAVDAAQPDVRGHVGHAHDAARLAARRRAAQPLARHATTCGCSSSARSSSPSRARGEPHRRRASAASRCPRSATHVGALISRRVRPPSWREPRAAAGRLLRRQGRARRAARRAARAVERRARGRAVPAPRPRGARPDRRRAARAGSARSTRRSRARGTSTAGPASSSTSG